MVLLVLLVLGLAVAFLIVTWRLQNASDHEGTAQTRLSAVLESLSVGFSVWNEDGRLVTCNGRFRGFYAGVDLKPGLAFEDLTRFTATRGLVYVPEDQIERWVTDRVGRFGHASHEEVRVADDRWLEIRTIPTGLGETVVLYADVTGQHETASALDECRQRLEYWSTRLALLHRAVEVGASGSSFDEAVQVVLALVGEWAGWPAGSAYLVAADKNCAPDPTGIWYLAEAGTFASLRSLTNRKGLPSCSDAVLGQAVQSGKVTWVTNLEVDPRISDVSRAALSGIRGICAVPIKSGGQVVALLEFFSREQLTSDDSMARLVSSVANQLGRVYERTRAIEAVRRPQP